MSFRSDILGNIETVLKAIVGLIPEQVYVGKLQDVSLNDPSVALPVVFVIQGSEQKVPEPVMGFETWNWTVSIEVWCLDTSVETLYSAIQSALTADITRGGFSRKFERTSGDVLAVDAARGISAFQQTYQIQYRHPYGTP